MPNPPGSEWRMVLAAVAVIRADTRVAAKYRNIVLLMDGDQPREPRLYDLYLTAVAVAPEDMPSESSNIASILAIEPVLPRGVTTKDSELEALTEFDEFRKLLYSKGIPLVDGNPTLTPPLDQTKIRSDDTLTFRLASMGTTIKNFRIPKYLARWADKIDPRTGERVG